MIKKLKSILGIESVKVALIVPKEINRKAEEINGTIVLTSMSDAEITSITIKLIEKYTRGRKKEKLIDEYIISKISVQEKVTISKDDEIKLPFDLPFKLVKSPMDEIGSQNFITKGIVAFAKKLKGVKSEYRILAEVNIKGTKLQPFAEEALEVKG